MILIRGTSGDFLYFFLSQLLNLGGKLDFLVGFGGLPIDVS